MWWSQRGRKWQYGGALHAGLVRLHSRTHVRTLTYPGARALAHTHTHTEICNAYCFSTARVVSWKHLNDPLYIHCLSRCIIVWVCCFVLVYYLNFLPLDFFFDAVVWYFDLVACSVDVVILWCHFLCYGMNLSTAGFWLIVWLSFSCWLCWRVEIFTFYSWKQVHLPAFFIWALDRGEW